MIIKKKVHSRLRSKLDPRVFSFSENKKILGTRLNKSGFAARPAINPIIFNMASLYSCAANVVDKVIKKQGTAKSLAINSPFSRKKKLYALVCETLKCKCDVK